jgi:capsular polysaccharide export protein
MKNKDKSSILFISLNPHQREYFHQLGAFLNDIYDVYYIHYGLSDFFGALRKPELPETVAFTQGELADMLRFLLIKAKIRSFSGFRGWMHSQAVLESQAHFATLRFYEYIRRFNIDLVCVWNGTLVPLASAARVARKLGKKTLFFENGYLPSTTTVDPQGVNNQNSLVGKPRSFYDAVIPDKEQLDKLYRGTASIRALKTKWYHRLIKKRPAGQPETFLMPERFVFLPFQVHDDTQVLLHSPQIKTMESLVDYVVDAVKKYNSAHNADLWIIAKEHPSDFGRVDYTLIKEKYQNEKILFLRYYPTPELIKKSCGVITLNSSVGIEALVQHKPVITLGNSFYNVERLVRHVTEPEKLHDSLSFVDSDPDHVLIDQFLYYLRYCYLAEGSWRQPDAEHYQSAAKKIAEVLSCV